MKNYQNILIAALFIPSIAFAQSESDCAALTNFSLSGYDVEITSARWYDNRTTAPGFNGPGRELPAHCHVDGAIDRRIGVNNKEYYIGFALNLPADWNGRFMFQGGGGLNGVIAEPLGDDAVGSLTGLDQGFAVVTTDTGHQAQSPFDGSFFADQEASLNFYYKANPKVAEVVKPLISNYYGSDIEYSYFVGCSTGGREGMLMAQRYPLYFDGIISGAPAMRTSLSNIGIRWVGVQLNQASPRDDNGLPLPGPLLNTEERQVLINALMTRCDGLDGVEDGLLFNTQSCDFDPRDVICISGAQGGCLSPDKAEAVYNAMLGPVDSRGIQVYPGFQYDPGIDDDGGLPGIMNSANNPPEGAGSTGVLELDVDRAVVEATQPHLIMGETQSVLMSSFSSNGGKQIFYHGAADPWFSINETIRYYEEMAAVNGGLETVKDWSRLFHVPGMAHCRGGEQTLDNFDLMTALIDWVENGDAPVQVRATGSSMPGVSRPLCAWPEYPHYNGGGETNDAANYSCRVSE
ncbi:MAG: tannase/feruloyl esterase family alpha/beta hydrolase [Gammaproteobacteria bacterium]|nr:tannase/feruloyl esterase family alpha/beta hydrolase [Gammaproteobacteria bacterium]